MSDQIKEPLVYGNGPTDPQGVAKRDTWQALRRGMKKKCPQCGTGRIFNGYVKVHDHCTSCGLELSGHRADDAPPYFTMLIAGHLVFPLVVEVKRRFDPSMEFQFALWGTVLFALIWWLLPVTKGALINLQWAKKMHGFSDTPDEDLEESLRS